jgi:hypothetical protein
MKPDTIENILHTTVGELAAAYYEAALEELGDERAAARVSRELVLKTISRHNEND